MSKFTEYLTNRIPLGDAAAYFIKVKQAAPLGVPGAAPAPDLLSVMAELVKAEFESIYAYRVYAQSLRDLSRDAIAEHFEEHADDEAVHADFLLKRMAVLGGPIQVPDIPAPAPSSDPIDIVQTMIGMEETGIAGWQHLLDIVGDDPMRVTIEDYMVKEQEHRDDLMQLLPHQPVTPTGQSPMQQPGPDLTGKVASVRMDQRYASMGLSARIGLMRKCAFDGNVQEWLAQEQMMQQAQEVSELEHYKQQAEETGALLQQKEQESQAMQEQMGQLQAQLDESVQSQDQVMQQAQMIQQTAAQSAASAHQAASASMLQAMQSAQEVLRHKTMTSTMQQNVQAWKDQVMGVVETDPTANAGEQVGMPMSGPVPPPPPDMMMGQDPTGQGMVGQAAPGAPPPEQPAAPAQAAGQPPSPQSQPDASQAQAKMAAWIAKQQGAKTAALAPWIERAVGATAGAGVGAWAGHHDSKRPLEPMKAELDELEARKNQDGGFANSMSLAQKKMRYHMTEAAHASPGRAMLMEGLAGAMIGAGAAPTVARFSKEIMKRRLEK